MASDQQPRWQLARVVEARPVATAIKRLVLTQDRAQPVPPGAHVDVTVKIGDRHDTRSYSIVDSADAGRLVAISVLRSPTSRGGAEFMHSLSVGDAIEATQPLQNFPLHIGASRYILLAGGIGITAIRGIAGTLKRLGANYELLYAGRTRGAMAYLDDLAELHGPRLRVFIRDEGTPLDVDALVADVASEGRAAELYMCGPIRLMDAIRRAWVRNELPLSRLRYETFASSGWFEAEPFTVTVPRLGISTRVSPRESILEALERAGADMMAECRKGECGLCQVKVLALDGRIDHRDVFFSEEERETVGKLCTCVSRVVRTSAAPGRHTPPGALTVELP